jgi:pimeloyl-ACP methyl ester carboxylesterase
MALSHWSSAGARSDYETAYRDSLALWPAASVSAHVDTPYGPTHVLSSGARDGDPLIALHAASLSATQWYPQAAALGARYRIHAVDIMADIGLSTQTRAIDDRAEAAAWLSSVLDGLGLGEAAFLGSSFGGFHAANLAVHQPDRVAALVLLAPAATIMPFRSPIRLGIRMGSLIPMPFTVKPGLRAMMAGGLPDERIVRQMELGVAGFRYDRHSIFPTAFDDAELAGISCPTQVLVGAQERIYDAPAAAARAEELIPRADVHVLPEVGHLLGMQRPDDIDALIYQFLRGAAS